MYFKKVSKIIAALFLAAGVFACTAPSKEEKVKEELKSIMEQNKAIGLAVAVVKDGQVIYTNSLGYKDLENKIELQDNDIFRIASISKSFTATGIMQLVEQGKINIEGDVSDYIGFKVRNPKYPDVPITIRMLLSHSSSLNDSQGYFTLNVINPDSSATWQNAYNDYEPGTKYEYCNLGYNTLGTILEKVSGERFDKYIVSHILDPLEVYGGYEVASLDSTLFVKIYEMLPDSTFKWQPEAYAKRTEEIANYRFGYSTPIFSPTGGMKISARDLAKVMTMHMNYGTGANGAKIIDEQSSRLMQSNIISPTDEGDAYGFAMRITEQLIPGLKLTGHTGGAYGVYTSMFFDPEQKWGIVTMTNGIEYKRENNFVVFQRQVNECLYNNFIKDATL